MGCPDKKVEKQTAGAALIKNPALAKEIIRAERESAPRLPISVKTRLGYNTIETNTWVRELLETKLDALTIHARTRKEMSLILAHWNELKKIVAMRDKISPDTLIIGNGGVLDIEDAKKIIQETGCDGMMLGKAIFGTPWLFANLDGKRSLKDAPRLDFACPSEAWRRREEPSVEKKLKIMVEHTKLFEELLGTHKNFAIMKKHYRAYCSGFDGAKELRIKLMETKDANEVENLVNDFLKH